MATTSIYPIATKEELQKLFVGKSIKDIATPAAVLDLSKLKKNCDRMLEACEELKFGWRAHIKTHKTTELTRLQVGAGLGPVNIIVSTLIEAEHIVPLLLEFKNAGRVINLLYSFPITPAAISRLASISSMLGPNALSLVVDHPSQLPSVIELHAQSSIAPLIFLKINMGGNRAGVVPQSRVCLDLIASLLDLDTKNTAKLLGLYSHAGQSYTSTSPADALNFLRQEFESLLVTAEAVHSLSPYKSLVLSVGATPTTTSVRNLLIKSDDVSTEEATAISVLRATIEAIKGQKCSIEIHAGVYPTLDIQQLATKALPTSGPNKQLGWGDLAFTVMAEVASLYPGRGANSTPEVLINAGVLALGREPCKAYSGWGILTPWNRLGVSIPSTGPDTYNGWYVGGISQEHGILKWNGDLKEEGSPEEKLEVGQKVRIWPNHSCITGAGYDWYLIVDSTLEGKEDEVVDVWPRWRGW